MDAKQALVRFVELYYRLDNSHGQERKAIEDECDGLLRRHGPLWAFELARLTGAEGQALIAS